MVAEFGTDHVGTGLRPVQAERSSAALYHAATALELVQSIQRGDLVGFRQRGIVEHGIAKILDTRSQGKDDLADVNDFRRPIADGMHSEQF